LSDPLRRREHDDWIAAEEWEIAWLESTHAEDRELLNHEIGSVPHEEAVPAVAPGAARRWWLALALGVLLGAAGSALVLHDTLVPSALARALGAKPDPVPVIVPAATPPRPPAPPVEADAADSWAVGQPQQPDSAPAPEVRALAVTQLVIPTRAPDCERELHTLVAPNGERWPMQSGYIDGFPRENQGSAMQILVDNSSNGSPVLVKVIDMARHSNVRHVYVQAHDTFTVDDLSVGKYEVRYQNISVGGTREDCLVRRKAAASDPMAQAAP
jgi:hypothetical protein